MKDLISIIVPVYKVEPYLDSCVESLVNQTYENLEIILVDDGSPDNCGAMCEAWAARDPRVRVLHKENGGLSDARNCGLAAAKGDYIGFVDSDDYVDATMYQCLYEDMQRQGSDISACGVLQVWDDGTTKSFIGVGCQVLNNHEAMEALLQETFLKQPVWYKLYKKEVVEGILFAKGKCHEDVFWTYQPIARAKKVSVFDTPLYFYRQRSGSIMGEPFSKKRLDAIEGYEQRIAFLEQHYPDLADRARVDTFFVLLYFAQQALRTGVDPALMQSMKDMAKRLRPTRGLSAKERLWVIAAGICFVGTCNIRNLAGIGV